MKCVKTSVRAPLGTEVCLVRIVPWLLESSVGEIAFKSPEVDCAASVFGDQNGPSKSFLGFYLK